jgi:hypothetical protein
VRSAHHPSGPSSRVLALLAAVTAAGCASDDLAPSIWPPPDFVCIVEELQETDGLVQVVRRFRIGADGIVVHARAAAPLVDAETGTMLPVWDRVSAYRLVPSSLRAFARRLDRLGIGEMDITQGERRSDSKQAVSINWTAFGAQRRVFARGRVFGPMADVLATVMAHLPDGERLSVPGLEGRPIVPVLRGVPKPVADVDGALRLHQQLLVDRSEDTELLLATFALACRAGRRELAQGLAQQWLEVEQKVRAEASSGTFPDGGQLLLVEVGVLQRLLPPPAAATPAAVGADDGSGDR